MSVAKKWVLLVDDEPDIRQTLKELIKIGFQSEVNIVEARDGQEATDKINHQLFDCIISDIKMPKKDGKALMTSIRQNTLNNRTPIIVLTGFPEESIVEDHPFVYMLKKPFQHQEIIGLLNTQLKISSGGGRLAADILNNIVSTVGNLLKTISGKDFEIESPRAKNLGEKIDQQYLSKIEFYVDEVHHSFAILGTADELQLIGDLGKTTKGVEPAKICYGIGHAVLSNALKRVSMLSMQKINVVCLVGAEVNDFAKIRSGIIIPIKSDQLKLHIFATASQKR